MQSWDTIDVRSFVYFSSLFRDGSVCCWSEKRGAQLYRLNDWHSSDVLCVDIGNLGRLLVTGSRDHFMKVMTKCLFIFCIRCVKPFLETLLILKRVFINPSRRYQSNKCSLLPSKTISYLFFNISSRMLLSNE